ncbi:MAG: hypothetical protein ABIG39_06570 [Candidatus Micrarchaeota archaeon]
MENIWGNMKKLKFTALLVLLLVLGIHNLSNKIGEIGFNYFNIPENDEIYLMEYGSRDQFTLYSTANRSCSMCGAFVSLSPGENKLNPSKCSENVTITCDGRALWFSIDDTNKPEYFNGQVSYDVRDQELIITVSGVAHTNGYRRMTFLVDGKEVLSPSFKFDGKVAVSERITPSLGKHRIQVSFLGETIGDRGFEIERSYPLALLLSAFLSIVLSVLLLRRVTPVSLLIGVGVVFSTLVFHFQLESLGLWWLAPLILLALIICAKHGGRTVPIPSVGWRQALAISTAFTMYILLLNLSIGNLDLWSSYYNRHADMTLLKWTSVYYDDLSYLGRQSTYPPGFFNLAASIGGIFGATDFTSFRLPFHIILAFLFALSTYAVFHRFSRRSAAIATAFILLQWFFTMTATTLSLHTFAYIMLNLSIIASLPLSFVFLTVAFATHPITIFMYPFYFYASRKFKLDIKHTVITPVAAVVISLLFYVPIFIKSGIPYEIVPNRWGYFFTYGLNGMHFEFLLFLPLILLSIWAVSKERYRIPALAVALFTYINAFVLYRVNILLTVMFAALFPLAFERELKSNRNVAVLSLFILANIALVPIIHSGTTDWCTWGISNDMCISPMQYIKQHTSTRDSVAIDPIYAHLEAYVGKRPVLADLYVEYADIDKFEAEDEFYCTGNLTRIRQYNLSFAIEDEVNWPPRPERRNLTISDGDQVYDNGFIHITRIRS